MLEADLGMVCSPVIVSVEEEDEVLPVMECIVWLDRLRGPSFHFANLLNEVRRPFGVSSEDRASLKG